MSRSISYCALILAYIATLFYLVAMCTPWWYTKYYPSDENTSEDQFYDNNPSLDQHNGLFDRTNCFIDGSCITHNTIYKNNSTLQWVYTTVLILMIVGWIPWLIFVHLLHARVNKNRTPMKGRRLLMIITALLTIAIILTAIIVFAAGMTQSNGVYNQGGLYGHLPVQHNGLFTGSNNNVNAKRSIEGPVAAEMLLNKRTGGSGGSGGSGGVPILPPNFSSGTGPQASTTSEQVPSSSAPVVIVPVPVPSTSEAASTTSEAASTTVPVIVASSTVEVASSSDTGIAVVPGTSDTTFASSAATTDTATGGDNVNNGNDGDIPFGYTGMNPSTGNIPPFAFGTLPYGGSGISLLGAGIPVIKNINASSIVGNLGYKYGASSAWYGALLALPFILGALILGLCVAPVGRVVTQSHAPVARSVVAAPAVIPAPAFVAPAIPAPAPVSHTVASVGPAIQHAPVAYANPGAAFVGQPTTYGASTIAPMATAPVFGAAPAALRDNTPLTRRVTNVYHDNN